MMSTLPAPKASNNIITPTIYQRNINSDTSNHLISEGFIGWSGAVIVAARTTTIIRLLTLGRETFIPSADLPSSTCPSKCSCPEGGKKLRSRYCL